MDALNLGETNPEESEERSRDGGAVHPLGPGTGCGPSSKIIIMFIGLF